MNLIEANEDTTSEMVSGNFVNLKCKKAIIQLSTFPRFRLEPKKRLGI